MSGHGSSADLCGGDTPGSLSADRASNRNTTARLPAYLERNMLAPRHWNPPGS